MNKKELKFYETPACEVMEVELQTILCGSTQESDVPGVDTESPSEVL